MRYSTNGATRDRRQKRRNRLGLILVVAGFFLLEPTTRGQQAERTAGHEAVSRRVEAVLSAPGYQKGHWGVLVVERKTGEVVYERNAEQLFAPASVTKLFSTAAARSSLGPGIGFRHPWFGAARWMPRASSVEI